jgi:hypothetical protein
MSNSQSLQMARARFAFHAVDGWSKDMAVEAIQRVQGLPVELRGKGLVVTIATLVKEKRHAHLAETIARWLLEEEAPHRPWSAGTSDAPGGLAQRLMAICVDSDRAAYLAAQTEVLALVEHIKRFAPARGAVPS